MALTMVDKHAERSDKSAWPPDITAEFEREKQNPNPCVGSQHVHDGTTVEYTYAPGETRHETYGPGQFKVHDLENLGDKEMVFMTIEFLQSANKPMPLPREVRRQQAA